MRTCFYAAVRAFMPMSRLPLDGSTGLRKGLPAYLPEVTEQPHKCGIDGDLSRARNWLTAGAASRVTHVRRGLMRLVEPSKPRQFQAEFDELGDQQEPTQWTSHKASSGHGHWHSTTRATRPDLPPTGKRTSRSRNVAVGASWTQSVGQVIQRQSGLDSD